MGTVSDKLVYLNGTKSALKDVLVDNGKMISDSDTFRSYATKFDEKFDELNTIIEDTFVEETKEGTSIDIDDALNYKATLEGKGRTEQTQLTGSNLFDKTTVTTGYRIVWVTGLPYADDTAIMSDFIETENNTVYSTSSQVYVIGYDDNKDYIGALTNNGFVKSTGNVYNHFTISNSSVRYIKVLGSGTNYPINPDTFSLNIGSELLPYEQYCGRSSKP